MCLAIPGRILSISPGDGFDRRASVDFDGALEIAVEQQRVVDGVPLRVQGASPEGDPEAVLRRMRRRVAGTQPASNGFAKWQLLKDLGPIAPSVRSRRGVLHDHNSGAEIAL